MMRQSEKGVASGEISCLIKYILSSWLEARKETLKRFKKNKLSCINKGVHYSEMLIY